METFWQILFIHEVEIFKLPSASLPQHDSSPAIWSLLWWCWSWMKNISMNLIKIIWLTSFSDWTAAHWITLDTGLRAMYWLWISESDLTSSIIWPEQKFCLLVSYSLHGLNELIIFSGNWKTKSQNIYKSYSVKAEFLNKIQNLSNPKFNIFTMLISELNWSVDSPTFLGDIKFNLQLLLNQIITEIFKFKQTNSLKYCSYSSS